MLVGALATAQTCDLQWHGQIVDERTQEPLIHAHIERLDKPQTSYTDFEGYFTLKQLCEGSCPVRITAGNGQEFIRVLEVNDAPKPVLYVALRQQELDEVVVNGENRLNDTQHTQKVQANYIAQEYNGSLAGSLEKLPGVQAMQVGSGMAKPMLRGLGLNRIAVSENGINQADQQWGADHGLAIDALAVDQVEIIKGVGALEYGSDAIGGVLKIDHYKVPSESGISGSFTGMAKSVNQALGGSLQLNYKHKGFFAKTTYTQMDYADFAVPADSLTYLNFRLPIDQRRLKNTAGVERNIHTQLGYSGERFVSRFNISRVYQKAGFFPGAHGIPSVERVKDDGDRRDIDYPYQRVTHFKLSNNTTYFVADQKTLKIDLSYQNNHRQEFSKFHTHYGNQAAPAVNPNLELDFSLKTYDVKLKWQQQWLTKNELKLGVEGRYQTNDSGGYNFFLPDYNSSTWGAFLLNEFRITDKSLLQLGMRYDWGKTQIKSYFDEYLYNFLTTSQYTPEEAQTYAQRSPDFSKNFDSFNVMLGFATRYQDWELRANLGTNFRWPTAIELGANGIHHGSFRHEQGNTQLDPEKGFVADLHISFKRPSWEVAVNPYVYYFDNYLFLNPTKVFSILPHAGQLYQYTQSEAILSGFEAAYTHRFHEQWSSLLVLEYMHNQQRTGNAGRDYPLPFTPANSAYTELTYSFSKESKLAGMQVGLNARLAAKQKRIAQAEIPTPGYQILGLLISKDFKIDQLTNKLSLRVSNLLNQKYYQHTSFYRQIDIPEQARNIQLTWSIAF